MSNEIVNMDRIYDFELTGPKYKGPQIKKKNLKIGIHIVLKNYKYSKLLFLNTLRCNHLSTKAKTKTNFFFFFFLVEIVLIYAVRF